MVPSSEAKRKTAGLLVATWKSVVLLNTCPVGDPGPVPLAAGGTVTTSGMMFPTPPYRVETPVPLSETQNGPLGDAEMPQELTRFGSVLRARPGTSETRFVW